MAMAVYSVWMMGAPNCPAWSRPANSSVIRSDSAATILRDGLERMYQKREDVFYYVTLMNENHAQPSLPDDWKAALDDQWGAPYFAELTRFVRVRLNLDRNRALEAEYGVTGAPCLVLVLRWARAPGAGVLLGLAGLLSAWWAVHPSWVLGVALCGAGLALGVLGAIPPAVRAMRAAPFDPPRWLRGASTMSVQQLATSAGKAISLEANHSVPYG